LKRLGFRRLCQLVAEPQGIAAECGKGNNTAAHLVLISTVALWGLSGILWARALAGSHRNTTDAWAYGLLAAWVVGPLVLGYLVSEVVHPILVDRYFLYAVPPASMIAGVACSRLRPRAVAAGAGMALLVLRAWVVAPSYGVSLEDWRGAEAAVVGRSQPGDCIAFFTSDGYMPFDYYVLDRPAGRHPPPRPVLPESSWASRAPHVLEPASIPARRLRDVVASCPRLWLVSSHVLGAPPSPGALAYQVLVYKDQRQLLREVNDLYRPLSTVSYVDVTVTLYHRAPH